MSLLPRIALLEAMQADVVERFQQQPWAVQRRVLDACAARLAAAGHLPAPPMPIDTFRQQPEAFRIWYTAAITPEAWYEANHAALIPAFFAALREEMPHGTP